MRGGRSTRGKRIVGEGEKRLTELKEELLVVEEKLMDKNIANLKRYYGNAVRSHTNKSGWWLMLSGLCSTTPSPLMPILATLIARRVRIACAKTNKHWHIIRMRHHKTLVSWMISRCY